VVGLLAATQDTASVEVEADESIVVVSSADAHTPNLFLSDSGGPLVLSACPLATPIALLPPLETFSAHQHR
jgi:hypothetical protein